LVKSDARVEKMAFLTHPPCERCAVLMVNARVKGVYYLTDYVSAGDPHPGAGLALLAEHGVETRHSW
jgi:deoxycytidylate deaminase